MSQNSQCLMKTPDRFRSSGSARDLPSSRSFIALLEAFRSTGGTASAGVVGRLLEEHQAGPAVSLARRVYTGQVFGFEWRASLWIPMFQFDAHDLALKDSARQVRAQLPALWSGWTVASWFARPNARLEGSSPAGRLDADPEAVLRAARALRSARRTVSNRQAQPVALQR